jgi:pimeloyl-ACP methyl ester carboxylesterase
MRPPPPISTLDPNSHRTAATKEQHTMSARTAFARITTFAALGLAATTASVDAAGVARESTSTTEPDSAAVESTGADNGADEATTASRSSGRIEPAPLNEPLPAGTYVSEEFGIPLSYTVPDEGWFNFEDAPDAYGLNTSSIWGIWCVCVWRDVAPASLAECAPDVANLHGGTSAEEIMAWLVAHPGLDTTEPTPVTVGGLDGFMIDVSIKPSWTETCPEYGVDEPVAWALVGTEPIGGGVPWGVVANESQRDYVLDLPGGGNIAISMDACCDPPFGDLDSPEYQQRVDAVTPVIDSFQFDFSDIVAGTATLPGTSDAPIGVTIEPASTEATQATQAPTATDTTGATPVDTAVEQTAEGSADRIEGLFDVGYGRRLYLHCQGTGAPTVIYLHGGGGVSSNAGAIPSLLHDDYRVCVYDRANVGRSDPAEGPRTLADAAEDLYTLLDVAEVPGPYALLGASLGGDIAFTYAGTHPDDVVGLVLLDPNMPGSGAWEQEFIPDEFRPSEEELKDMWRDDPEHMDFSAWWEQLDAAANNFPAVPALLLIPDEDHNEVPPEFREAAEAYRELQEDAMDLFDPGEVRLVASPHYMEPEIPDEIAVAVREVIDGPVSAETSVTPAPTTSN